jgi:anti-sigma factor RsiW
MSDRYTERLSDYLDQELDTAERSELEKHLLECAECAATLAGLKRVVARAEALAEDAGAGVDARVAADLWPAIAARIQSPPRAIPIGHAGGPDRRRSFSMPQLLAACLVAAVLSGAAVWYAQKGGPRETGELIPGSASRGAAAEPAAAHPGASAAAIEEVRAALANGRDDLDPATVRTLEESLMVIEIAIREARRALDADPRNPYIRAHLDETMRRKVELLHRATMLASAPR